MRSLIVFIVAVIAIQRAALLPFSLLSVVAFSRGELWNLSEDLKAILL